MRVIGGGEGTQGSKEGGGSEQDKEGRGSGCSGRKSSGAGRRRRQRGEDLDDCEGGVEVEGAGDA